MDLRNTISFFFDKAQARANEEKAFEKTNLSALSVSTKQKKRRRSNFPILSNSPFCISILVTLGLLCQQMLVFVSGEPIFSVRM